MKKPLFLNTNVLDQINWEKEIDNQKPVSKDAQFKRLSEAVQTWVLVKENCAPKPDNLGEEHSRANLKRLHQYFYAKFLYHHALAYGRDLDLSKRENTRDEDVIDYLNRVLGDKLERSKVPLKTITDLQKMFVETIRQKDAEEKEKDGGYDEVKKLFQVQGLKCVKPKGLRKEEDRDTVCTVFDGVRYHLSLMKNGSWNNDSRTVEKAKQEADEHKEMIDWYHPLVKQIYEKIKQFPNVGDVWAMEGGGMQHQVFFGNETGYLAILYLDMKSKKKKPVYHNYTLQVNWSKNDKLFKDFKVEHVKVRTSESVYGKDSD